MFDLTFSVKKIMIRQGDIAVLMANNLQTPNSVIQRKLSRTMKVVGEFRTIFEKDTFNAKAEIREDKMNGLQYIQLVSDPEMLKPESEEALVDFLCARISRLGPKKAKAIVDHLKMNTIHAIINDANVLLHIPNFACSTSKALQIADILRQCSTFDEVGIFIRSVGLPLYVASEIYKKYENNSLRVIHTNPYSICYDGQISFKSADQIAEHLKFDAHNPIRVQTAIISFLNYALSAGHTCYPRDLIYGTQKESLNEYLSSERRLIIFP
jgi:exodeoxyribonuclease V alpha subunit